MNYRFNSLNNTMMHYFTLPNEIFCLGLSSGEIAVYSYLLRCENRKTYQCYPSYRTIGQAMKMSQNTVRKYVQSLEDKHLISTERTEVITKDGRNATVLCSILSDLLQKLLITFIVSSCGETHNFEGIMKSRLKWGVTPRSHIRRQSRLLWDFQRSQK